MNCLLDGIVRSKFVVIVLLALVLAPKCCNSSEINVALLGNSILFCNDAPKLLENMLKTKYDSVHQESCLRGGATLASLWNDGNMEFLADNHYRYPKDLLESRSFDYVILQDQTQTPVRIFRAMQVSRALKDLYAPLLLRQQITPILLQTFAYNRPMPGSTDLGPVANFTRRLEHGYQRYWETLDYCGLTDAKIAPVGSVFLWVHDHNKPIWDKLYGSDGIHPSPHGTYLLACVLYITITHEPPPVYRKAWWDSAREYMSTMVPLSAPDPAPVMAPLPTEEEAEIIRASACEALNVTATQATSRA